MRHVRHTFSTVAEANAFTEGVLWVNDSAIEAIDVEVGDDKYGHRATVLCSDDDGGDTDFEIDYREDAR